MSYSAQVWAELGQHFARDEHWALVGADLLKRYAEPHRAYHKTTHLEDVLRRIDELASEAADVDAVRLAAYFHDAVYVPTAADNEEQSAQLARSRLAERGLAAELADEVARLVRGTQSHEAASGDRNAAVLYDADLAILAADDATYTAYVEAVRIEYAHLEETAFNRGRGLILRNLLDRPAIFATNSGRDRWEQAARTNMRRELALGQDVR